MRPTALRALSQSLRNGMARDKAMRRRDCVRNLDTPFSVRQETPADDNEMRILECRVIMQRSAGTRLDITRGLYVG